MNSDEQEKYALTQAFAREDNLMENLLSMRLEVIHMPTAEMRL
ncbi:hypothetical protein [Paenibacillus chibensis]|nr:hypothetical protein [Paenibacillus chibensis]MEC0371259.1 hypothetical protein [Paenibacillus chibensis]